MSFPPSYDWPAKIIGRANTFGLMKNEGGLSDHLAQRATLASSPPSYRSPGILCIIEGRNPKRVTIPFLLVFSTRKTGMGELDKSWDTSWAAVSMLPGTFSRCLLLASSPVPSQIVHHCPQDLTFPPSPCAQELALPPTAQKLKEAIKRQFPPLPALQPISSVFLCMET